MKKKITKFTICLGILFLAMMTKAQAQNEELKLDIFNGHSGGGDKIARLFSTETGKEEKRYFVNSIEKRGKMPPRLNNIITAVYFKQIDIKSGRITAVKKYLPVNRGGRSIKQQ